MPDTPLLRTPMVVADYLQDDTHTRTERAAAYDMARARFGVREGDRLWRIAGTIVELRRTKPGSQVAWCCTCGRFLTLLPDGRLPAHTHQHRYDQPCPGTVPASHPIRIKAVS